MQSGEQGTDDVEGAVNVECDEIWAGEEDVVDQGERVGVGFCFPCRPKLSRRRQI